MMVSMDEETPEEVEDVTKLRAKLEKLVRNNVEVEDGLIKKGVKPNAFVIASIRLDLLLEFLMTETQRYEYEIESAKRVHGVLMQIHQDLIQSHSKLVTPEKGLEVPTLKL